MNFPVTSRLEITRYDASISRGIAISILFDENNLVDSWTIEEIDVTD